MSKTPTDEIPDEMIAQLIKELKNDMGRTVECLSAELGRVRTGRANLALLDGIKVDYYGAPTPLNQVASLQLADARLIVIKPWSSDMVGAVEKAIQQANLGLNPNSDGEIIRLPVPPTTEDRRKEIVKTIKRLGEDYKVKLRGLRRDANEMLKALEKDKEISEDDNRRGQTRVQEITDDHTKRVDTVIDKKETEVMDLNR